MEKSTFFLLFFIGTCTSFSVAQIRAGNSEKCDDTILCDSSKGLECIYGSCSCITGEGFEYHTVRDRCVGRFNSQCSSSNDCTDNAECSDLFCSCGAGFSPSRSAHCLGSSGTNCTSNVDCNEDRHLTCSESKKQCECNPNSLVFDQDSKFCVSKIGEACDPQVDAHGFPIGRSSMKCSNSAQCKKTNVNSSEGLPTYKCECGSDQEQVENVHCRALTKGAAGNLQGFSLTFTLFSVIFIGKLLN